VAIGVGVCSANNLSEFTRELNRTQITNINKFFKCIFNSKFQTLGLLLDALNHIIQRVHRSTGIKKNV
jgi:hypothetical protein